MWHSLVGCQCQCQGPGSTLQARLQWVLLIYSTSAHYVCEYAAIKMAIKSVILYVIKYAELNRKHLPWYHHSMVPRNAHHAPTRGGGAATVDCFISLLHSFTLGWSWTLPHLRTLLSCEWRIKTVSDIGIMWEGVCVRGSVVNGDVLDLPEFRK